MSFYNNDLDDDAAKDEILREKEEEQEQWMQKMYDSGEIVDYQSKNNGINDNCKVNTKVSKEKQELLKEVFSQKYIGNDYLAEAVLIDNKSYFAVSIKRLFVTNDEDDSTTSNKFPSILLQESIPLDETTILKPPELTSYLNKPYAFKSKEEFYEYIEQAKQQTDLYTIFKNVKSIWKKYVDTDDFHISICATDTIFSYLQDRIGLTHYLFFIGNNGSGKSNNLVIFHYLGYRNMMSTDVTAANIYQYLGNLQEGQGTLCEDEADNIDEDTDKMRIYKNGYSSGFPVFRTDTTYGRKQYRFFTFCFKAFAAEKTPDSIKAKGLEDQRWVFNNIIKFLQYQKERVEKTEISGGTLRNFVKTIKLFCEMSEIPIHWKKITRGLPKSRKYADDRAPTSDIIRQICGYPDRRIKGIVYTMASSGIRLGAWDYLRWKDVQPIERRGKVIAAKIIVYAGDVEEYFSFITAEAYLELQKWMQYRQDSGEEIHGNSSVMRRLWDTKKGYYHHGTIKKPVKLKSSGIKRLMEDALWTQGIRKKSDLIRHRYDFQTNHGFRKWFKTQCEISGMKSINIEILMGHSIGISDSYYKITEDDLLTEYLKASDFLVINNENQLQIEVNRVRIDKQKESKFLEEKLNKKDTENKDLKIQDKNNIDAISAYQTKFKN